VDAFTLENGLLTQTLKQKRKEIEKLYSSQIESMYEKQIKKENLI
jgi:long-chain acyl-CoA synthetase